MKSDKKIEMALEAFLIIAALIGALAIVSTVQKADSRRLRMLKASAIERHQFRGQLRRVMREGRRGRPFPGDRPA
jgi:hypothetical protein